MSNVASIIQSLGSECFDKDKEWLGVTTPHFYADGRPSTYYIKTSKDRVWIRDVGLNMRMFADNLPMPDKAKEIIKRQINQTSDSILFNGTELQIEASIAELKPAISAMLGLLSRITSYCPSSSEEQSFDEVVTKIKGFLFMQYGNTLEQNINVFGASGAKHHFDFKAGSKFIDVCEPTSENTGKLLRKGLDLSNFVENLSLQVFMDDREKSKAFKREAEILSNLYAVTPISRVLNLTS
ncbi:hypothetical protein DOL92_04610 [Acinetobacter nosocomialis]|uniref:hypothetical protein n=1 Tax=Acinetobacter nosocomialis TaxID=106654 RepID=UPI000DA94E77|nr:hypothetical protein [Acinetobacter nosocomialis]PZM04667.1 hypothetical protein DOL92_04610 [Acinetobacter nosocomialis]